MYNVFMEEDMVNNKWLVILTFVLVLVFNPVTVFGNPVTVRNLVGTWELENTVNFPSELAVIVFDFFDDGTGIQQGRLWGIPFSTAFRWQLRSGNRIQMDSEIYGTQVTQIYNIELTERNTLLTFHIDGFQNIGSDRPGRTMYRRR